MSHCAISATPLVTALSSSSYSKISQATTIRQCSGGSTCLAFLPQTQAHTIGALERALYFSENAARQLAGDCRYLSGCLQRASQHVEDLNQALSDVSTQKKAADRVSPTTCPVPWQPGFPDAGVIVKVPSAGWSILPRRQHGPFLVAFMCGC
ncbi:hypothetical protein AAY473_010555 [Plecturocebus cupreus]